MADFYRGTAIEASFSQPVSTDWESFRNLGLGVAL
jgi:hypothetical protein